MRFKTLKWQLSRFISLGWRPLLLGSTAGTMVSLILCLALYTNSMSSRVGVGLDLFESYYNNSEIELKHAAANITWGQCDAGAEEQLQRLADRSHFFDYFATLSDLDGFCRDEDLFLAPYAAYEVLQTGAGPIWVNNISLRLRNYQIMALKLTDDRYLFGVAKSRHIAKLLFSNPSLMEHANVTLKFNDQILLSMGKTDPKNLWQHYKGIQGPLSMELSLTAEHILLSLKKNILLGVGISLLLSLIVTISLLYVRSERGLYPEDLLGNFSNRELFPMFQPIVDGRNGKILGHEMLARWHHEQMGDVSPNRFIPMLERHNQLDRLLYELAPQCHYQPEYHGYLSINLASQQLMSRERELLDFLDHLCRQIGVLPSQVLIEITEREPLDYQSTSFQRILSRLRNHGFKMALDDFGTGHNGLEPLRAFQPDYLKVDRSFIEVVNDRNELHPLLDSILQMANKLNVEVIAEGIETQEQRHYLLKHGVTRMQGYLFSKPRRRPQSRPINISDAPDAVTKLQDYERVSGA